MAKKWKVWVEPSAVYEVMNSAEVKAVLEDEANKIQARAGEGYEVTVQNGTKRASARVRAATPKAYYSNLKHNTLLKAMGGG